jgi:SAM-dependent methyltransferase
LRRESASKIIDTIGSLRGGRGGRLLDVGCSYGWFLEAAERRGWDARGIEPDQVTARRATQAGRKVELGRFPDDLEDAAPFDVITFNDVFEHLRCPQAILRECGVRLTSGGLVVLNMPSTRGPIYHLSEAAAAAGFVGPLRRMFQLPFAYPVPCPHLFYYGREGVARLARDASFRVVHRHGLPIVSWSTAKSRVGLDTTLSGTPGTVQLLGLCALVPAVRLWPSKDIEVHYLSKVS